MRQARVLVVEDCPDTANTMSILFRHWGHETFQVHSGAEAIPAALAYRPDVAILDIGLPGMDGFAVAEALRRQHDRGQLMLVALTGYGQEEFRKRSYEAGFDHYLVKPIPPSVLKALLAGE